MPRRDCDGLANWAWQHLPGVPSNVLHPPGKAESLQHLPTRPESHGSPPRERWQACAEPTIHSPIVMGPHGASSTKPCVEELQEACANCFITLALREGQWRGSWPGRRAGPQERRAGNGRAVAAGTAGSHGAVKEVLSSHTPVLRESTSVVRLLADDFVYGMGLHWTDFVDLASQQSRNGLEEQESPKLSHARLCPVRQRSHCQPDSLVTSRKT